MLGDDLPRKNFIVEAIVDVFKPKCVIEKNEMFERRLEGLEPKTGVLYGSLEADGLISVKENSLDLLTNVIQGQKVTCHIVLE